MSPRSGRIIGADGVARNVVDLLGGAQAIGEKVYDIEKYAPRSGEVIGEDGRVYNEVELLGGIRHEIDELAKLKNWLGETTAPLTVGSTTNPITISGVSVTAEAGDVTAYDNGTTKDEFIFSGAGTWQAYDDKLDVYTKDETDTLLDGKVDKVQGKGLSTNDFTDSYKDKVDDAVPNAGNTKYSSSSTFDLERGGAVTIGSTLSTSEFRAQGNATLKGGYGATNGNGGAAQMVANKTTDGGQTVARTLKIEIDENNKGVLTYNGEKIEFTAGTGIQIDHPTGSVAISGRTMSVGSVNGNLSFTQTGAVLTADGDVDINPEGDARVTSEEGDVVLKANSSTGKIYAVVNTEDDPEGVTPTDDDVVATVGYVDKKLNLSKLTVDNIEQYFAVRRTGKVYRVRIPKFDSNTTTVCTQQLDAVGLVAVPSTDTVVGRDDWLEIPLFQWFRCNYVRQADSTPVITAVKGDGNYTEVGNVDVGSFGMSFYFAETEDEDYRYWTISDSPNETYGLKIWPGCVDGEGNELSYWCYSAFGGLWSKPNQAPYIKQSHNSMVTNYQTKGAGYWGSSIDRYSFGELMMVMKYGYLGGKSSQNVMKGCCDYDFQYTAADKTLTGVTYFPLTTAEAANVLVGSWVEVGHATGGADRGNANMSAYTGIVKVLDKVTDGNIVKIYLDTERTFDTADVDGAAVYISSMPWGSGSTEAIVGMHDGSLYSNTSGKTPFRIMGIEFMNGSYEVVGNTAMRINADYSTDFFVAPRGVAHSANTDTIANTYTNTATMSAEVGGSTSFWIGDESIDADSGVYLPATRGSGDSVGVGDQCYRSDSTGWREALLFGYLRGGSGDGLCHLLCVYGLGYAYWHLSAAD